VLLLKFSADASQGQVVFLFPIESISDY